MGVEGYPGHLLPSHSCIPSFLFRFLLRQSYHDLIGKWLVRVPIQLPCRTQQGREAQEPKPREEVIMGVGNVIMGVWQPCPLSLPGSSVHQHCGDLAERWWVCLPTLQALLNKRATLMSEMQKTGLTLIFHLG